MGAIVYTNEVRFESFGDMLWGEGRERWNEASDETRRLVWERIEKWANCLQVYKDVPSFTQINNIVSWHCDDLFFPSLSEGYKNEQV